MLAARSSIKLTASRFAAVPRRSGRVFASRRAHITAAMAQTKEANVTLYTFGTPNGWKPSIVLEELGLQYNVESIDISTNRQKEEWFLKICPNGRIPALIDHDEGDFNIWESGSIMIYLADKFGAENLLPKDLKQRTEVINWLMFQMFAPEEGRTKYAQQRYLSETKRLYGVLDGRLKDPASGGWLATGQYTLADIANFSWVAASALLDEVDLNEFPALHQWYDKILARPAVQKGLNVPSKNKFVKMPGEE